VHRRTRGLDNEYVDQHDQREIILRARHDDLAAASVARITYSCLLFGSFNGWFCALAGKPVSQAKPNGIQASHEELS